MSVEHIHNQVDSEMRRNTAQTGQSDAHFIHTFQEDKAMVKGILLLCLLLCICPIARADVVLTVNGSSASDLPLMPLGDKFTVAVGGNTAIEPNNVSLKAAGGLLTPGPDGNNAYHFEILPDVTEAVVRLIANVDMVIDCRQVSAEMTIYELYFLPCPDAELVAVCGVGLNDLLARQQPKKIAAEAEAAALADGPPITQVSTEAVSFNRPENKTPRVLLHCPNSVSAVRPAAMDRATAVASPGSNLEIDAEQEMLEGDEGGGVCFMMGTQSIIDVGSDITTNQIWTADNIYHIVADISVQALLVIEPGTIVTFAPDVGMFVNNGGVLISAGTPDEPIVYTSDAAYPDYGDYYCAIFIRRPHRLRQRLPTAISSTQTGV